MTGRRHRAAATLVVAAMCVLTAAGCAGDVTGDASGGAASAPAGAATGTPTAAPTGSPAEPTTTGKPGGGAEWTNNKGEPLDERLVLAAKEANPDNPDAYQELPGTDYANGEPVPMVIEGSNTSGGHLKFKLRETDAPKNSGAGDGIGPVWFARADDATFYTLKGVEFDIVKFAAQVNEPDNASGQVYDITFDKDLAVVDIKQR